MSMSYDSNSWFEDDDDNTYINTANNNDRYNYNNNDDSNLKTLQEIKPNTIIGDSYRTLEKLGSGSFGQIFLGQIINSNNDDNGNKVAIKLEPNNKHHTNSAQLVNEMRIYKILHENNNPDDNDELIGFPKVYWFGKCLNYNVLVIELLGKNLEEIFQICEQNFTLKTTLYIVLQLLNRFEFIHSKNIAYRDVKPENFLLGNPCSKNRNIIHVVDFGLSKEFINPATKQHIPYREGKNLTGTARYMSINSHFGIEQSRRDDLESLGHLFMYFLCKGKLPWSGLKASNLKERYRKIGKIKQATQPEQLCDGNPQEFASYLRYTRCLKFDQQPDYDKWKNSFQILFNKYNTLDNGARLDWEDKII